MEVEGKRGAEMDESEDVNLTCDSCDDEGQLVKAEGFCESCLEYMCNDCLKYHRKSKLTKHHAILDRTSMPTKKPETGSLPMCTERCKQHPAEIIKFFCSDHDTVGCSDCMILDHNQCKKKYITEIALSFVEGEDFKTLIRGIEDVKCRATSTRTNITKEESEAGRLIEEAVQAIHGFRKEINNYLDKSEHQLILKCTEIQKNNTKFVVEATEKLDLVKGEIDCFESEVKSKRDRPADLFVTAKRLEMQLKKAQCTVEQINKSVEIKKQRFIESNAWRKHMDENVAVGELKDRGTVHKSIVSGPTDNTQSQHQKLLSCEAPSETTIEANSESKTKTPSATQGPRRMTSTIVGSIKIKSTIDSSAPYISSIALLPSGELICTDWFNKSLKVVDTKVDKISSELKLQYGPWNAVVISDINQVAVTLPVDQTVQFFTFKQGLLLSRSLKTEGSCRGLDYCKDKLFVSFEYPPKVQIVDLQGIVIQTFDNQFYNRDLFSWPFSVCVDRSDHIIVSDFNNKSVLKLAADGNLLGTYTQAVSPSAVAVLADNSILVSDGCEVSVITKDCQSMTRIFQSESIYIWSALCVNERNGILYVARDGTETILKLSFQFTEM